MRLRSTVVRYQIPSNVWRTLNYVNEAHVDHLIFVDIRQHYVHRCVQHCYNNNNNNNKTDSNCIYACLFVYQAKVGKWNRKARCCIAFRASVQMLINYVHDKFPYNSLPFEDSCIVYLCFYTLYFLAMEKQIADTLVKRDTFHGWHLMLGRWTWPEFILTLPLSQLFAHSRVLYSLFPLQITQNKRMHLLKSKHITVLWIISFWSTLSISLPFFIVFASTIEWDVIEKNTWLWHSAC